MADEHWSGKLDTEALRGNETLIKYDTSDAALQGLVDAQGLIGKKGIIPPGEDATDADREAFTKAITEHGETIRPILAPTPETAGGYELKIPEGLPEGVTGDEKLLGGFAETAHKLKLTKDQAKGLFDFYNEHILSGHEANQNAFADNRKTGEEILRKKFGPKYDEKLDLGKSVIKRFGSIELVKYLDAHDLSNDPGFINFMVGIGEVISEDTLNQGGDGTSALFSGTITRERLREMKRDPRYADPQKRDNDFIKRVSEGYKQLAEQEAQRKAA